MKRQGPRRNAAPPPLPSSAQEDQHHRGRAARGPRRGAPKYVLEKLQWLEERFHLKHFWVARGSTSLLKSSRRCSSTPSYDSSLNASVVATGDSAVGSRPRTAIWRIFDGGAKLRCLVGLNVAAAAAEVGIFDDRSGDLKSATTGSDWIEAVGAMLEYDS